MNLGRALSRAPWLGLGILALVLGILTGLRRLGWSMPQPHPHLFLMHGALMVGGFLGTLIGLERAVALRQPWAYLAPISSVLSVILLLLNQSKSALLSLSVASVVLMAIYRTLWHRHHTSFTLLMEIGAACWLIGNLLWVFDAGLFSPLSYTGVYCWMAFALLTILGERLELNRLFRFTPVARWWLWTAAGSVSGGLLLLLMGIDESARLVSGGMLLIAAWLLRYDLARYMMRQHGLTCFIGWSLVSGYLWLGVSGAIGSLVGNLQGGVLFDAMVHAFFVGFVFAMIFGHAPIIFPAILSVPIPYRSCFYAHLVLLHLSLLIRLTGDLSDTLWLRQWGGLSNAAAILLFLLNTILTTMKGARMPSALRKR